MESRIILSPMLSPERLAEVDRQARTAFLIFGSTEDLAKEALFYKALGDPTRLRIIGLLLVSDICLCQLVELLGIPASTVTHHLQVLDRGGIIATKRDGKFSLYSIRAPHREMLRNVLNSLTSDF